MICGQNGYWLLKTCSQTEDSIALGLSKMHFLCVSIPRENSVRGGNIPCRFLYMEQDTSVSSVYNLPRACAEDEGLLDVPFSPSPYQIDMI